MEEKIIVGLDIGTTKVCAVVGRMNEHNQLEILGLGHAASEGVRDGTVSNIAKTTEAIDQAITDAENDSNIEINVVNVGVAGKHIKSFRQHGSITLPHQEDEISVTDVERLTNDMYRVITEPGTEIIHVLPLHYTVDSEEKIKDPVGMAGVKLEADFHIVTANSNSIRNITKCIERSNLENDQMMLEPLASSMAVLSEEEKEAGVAIIDIGGGTTDIAIFYDGIIRHTAVIPFGGDIITSDIKQGCAVMQNQAELLKVKFGQSMAANTKDSDVVEIPGINNRTPKEVSIKNLAYIIEARMEEIIDLISAELKDSGYMDKLAGGLVLTGGGAKLRNLQHLFEYKIGLDTRIGYPIEFLGKSHGSDRVKDPKFATALGLALAGFKSIDERDKNRPRSIYQQPIQQEEKKRISQDKSKVVEPTSPRGKNIFSDFLQKAKDLLIDDYDDDEDYKD
ncbi:cell division protein FtsA [Flammeovirga yaeyamensis]|uniref:Cell division protein FtsA n=1 Tax=Flammeovirga yaeyamensis TaxID=367791 RepID=A0AAX1N5N2_9BACT|nr:MULTISPECIES: cell division protein FtsA [Flammeovirga]ANQ47417.1 cell division protein FtsA [Flammeovirga sp. MY04]MBB3698463.1 cell division protein FtsA [Flammeovirga yaeyamensis]NMF34188.1 cell division protein FtsA [Flammeovirga yaeyamensis]QWG01173.1 cell division protein FtsA [Flammeovirga yaeyamensis]